MSGEGALHSIRRAHEHADFCDWHVDQYPWECRCGAIPDPEAHRPAWLSPGFEPDPEPAAAGPDDDYPLPCAHPSTGWRCYLGEGHGGPCAAWPAGEEPGDASLALYVETTPELIHLGDNVGIIARPERQARIDSALEVATNIAIGLAVSLLAQLVIFPAFGIYTTLATDLGKAAAFTVVSVARQYIIRRIFNGRAPYRAIKAWLS